MILAGDVGGTKTNLALYEVNSGNLKERFHASFPSKDFPSFTLLVQKFLEQSKGASDELPGHACFGVAGPVRNRMVQVTNLPWTIDAAQVERDINLISVSLLNDLEANAYGIITLRPDELVEINPRAEENSKGNRALIAAGTGLGEAGLVWDGKRHLPFATEGGHASFAPNDSIGDELLMYLRKERGHVSWERVLSGLGLTNLYRFFRQRSGAPEPAWLQEQIAKGDLNAVVSQAGMDGKDPVCTQAVDYFIQNYGAEAGNLGLKMLSLGGMYIGGGIAPKMLPKMQSNLFLSAFMHKGRLSPLLEAMPVRVILNSRTALQGAAWYALQAS